MCDPDPTRIIEGETDQVHQGSFLSRGTTKNRTLCKEGAVGSALLEEQPFTCLVPSLNTISNIFATLALHFFVVGN
jgi:hypothetical protein